MSARPASAHRTPTADERRDAILAAMPKEDLDALAAALARLLLSAERAGRRADVPADGSPEVA
jgi:hypothetical protein